VLLAGDAAHVHAPDGGQGLTPVCRMPVGKSGMEAGAGGQANITGQSLDSYHAERHPVGARVLRNSMAASRCVVLTERHHGTSRYRGELVGMEERANGSAMGPAWTSL